MNIKKILSKILSIILGIFSILITIVYIKKGYAHPVFAITWGITTAISLFFMETKSWWLGKSVIKLSPQIQLVLLLFVVFIAIITTNWTSIGFKDTDQWMSIIFITIPLNWNGIVWAWKNLIKKAA